MVYCEFWLEMREEDNAFRVMLLLFEGVDAPNAYTRVENQTEVCDRNLYASPWFPSIFAAQEEMTRTAQSYSAKNVKILIIREIRMTVPPCEDSGTNISGASKKRRERGH